jgi:glycosyltransferase involved in cell wall biosynthesis
MKSSLADWRPIVYRERDRALDPVLARGEETSRGRTIDAAGRDGAVNLSVCMATYNGAPFLHEQLDSIFAQLGPQDELVVVDDASTDDTRAILESYRDPRVRLYFNPVNRGVVRTFEAAMMYARGEIIFLSDQDDRWLPGRLALMTQTLRETEALVVASNWAYMDPANARGELRAKPLRAADSRRHFLNIWNMFAGTTAYYGCGMALHRSLLEVVLPIPAFVESHDLWIAMASNLLGATAHLDSDTLARRLHDRNASVVQRSLYQKLWARWIMVKSLFVILGRNALRQS